MNIIQGDSIEELKKLPDNSVDAIVTDPPYGLEFMGKEWDKFKSGERKSFVGGGGDVTEKTNDAYMRINKTANRPSALSLQQKYEMQEFFYEWAIECLRVLKPGGFLLAFGGTRTYHRLACGIEDAGFEIRDCIQWLYGSGFPKSLNIAKQLDKRREGFAHFSKIDEIRKFLRDQIGRNNRKELAKLCNVTTRQIDHWIKEDESQPQIPSLEKWEILRKYFNLNEKPNVPKINWKNLGKVIGEIENPITWNSGDLKRRDPTTSEAKQWEGWGTALKPACEPIVVARKPLSEKNVALNVLKWGTGGINIDSCRIPTNPEVDDMLRKVDRKKRETETWEKGSGFKNENNSLTGVRPDGRFPANIILDEEAGRILDEQSGTLKSGSMQKGMGGFGNGEKNCYGESNGAKESKEYNSSNGGASRFFYCAKASKSERNYGCEDLEPKLRSDNNKIMGNPEGFKTGSGNERNGLNKNNHPTVKPIKLMEYLVKLVSKEGATVLDPFMGSGTTLIACIKLGRKGIGIEKEPDYIKIAEARIKPYTEQRRLYTS